MAWQSADKLLRMWQRLRWKKRYPEFSLDPALMGASAIILYREWVQVQPRTVVYLQKMRSHLGTQILEMSFHVGVFRHNPAKAVDVWENAQLSWLVYTLIP